MRATTGVILCVLAISGATGCGDSGEPPEATATATPRNTANTPDSAPAPGQSPSELPTPPSSVALPSSDTEGAAPLGQAVTLTDSAGTQITVVAHEFREALPAPDEYSTPSPGHAFAAADVQICLAAAGQGQPNYLVSSFDWGLVLKDDTQAQAGHGLVIEPQLPSRQLTVGRCTRGWVEFEVPTRNRPKLLEFATFDMGPTAWKLA